MHKSIHFYEEEKNQRWYKKEQLEEMCKKCDMCMRCNTGLAVTKGECGEEGAEPMPPFPFISMPRNEINKEGEI